MILELNQLSRLYRSEGKTVLCHGVFDLIHAGHLKYFERAKELGECLIVSVTKDEFVNKGPGRPIFNTQTRAAMLSALKIIDFVVISPGPTAVEVIKAASPDFYVKGPDYKTISNDKNSGIFEEEQAVKACGGALFCTDDEVYSSSELINKSLSPFSNEQKETIEKIQCLGGIDKIKEIFKELESITVSVAGEPIIDKYVFCEPQGISSKSPSISARHLFTETYNGGSAAVSNAVQEFVKESHLVIHGPDWPEKIRFIEADKSQRIFELTQISDDLWNGTGISKETTAELLLMQTTDVNILCDFGHGFFDEYMLKRLEDLKGFVALNCQTNSSNFGFNPFTRHKRWDYLSIDLREARIAFHDRYSRADKLFDKLVGFTDEDQRVSMTLGSSGSFYEGECDKLHTPAFACKVVDATGAGDAYFAITSLLNYIDCDPELIPFIGNVYAGLATKIIGNKKVVTKTQTLKALESILK